MTSRGRYAGDRVHRLLIGCGVGGLTAWAWWTFDWQDRSPAVAPAPVFMAAQAPISPMPNPSSVAPLPATDPGPVRSPQAAAGADEKAVVAPPSTAQPSPEFRFLGTTREGEQTTVFLHRGGRTLTVRGVGPIDDDYVVDAIEPTHLVLRRVGRDETRIIELAAPAPKAVSTSSAANTPPD